MSAASAALGAKFIFGCGPAIAPAILSASKPYLRAITSNGGETATTLRPSGAILWQAAQWALRQALAVTRVGGARLERRRRAGKDERGREQQAAGHAKPPRARPAL